MIQMSLFNPDPPTTAGSIVDDNGKTLGCYTYLTSNEQDRIDTYCDSLLAEYKNNPNYWIVVDLECSGLNFKTDKIWLIAIGSSEQEAVIVNPYNVDMTKLKEVLNTIPLTNHNIKFDNLFLKKNYGVNPKVHLDTMIGGQILEAGVTVSYSLEAMGMRWNIAVLDKKITMEFTRPNFTYDSIENHHVNYAALDAVVTYKLGKVLEFELKHSKLWKEVWVSLDRPTLEVVMDIEYQGVPIDIPKVKEVRAELEKEHEKTLYTLKKLWTPFNHASNLQVLSVLNARAKIKSTVKENAKVDNTRDLKKWAKENIDGEFSEECKMFLKYDLDRAAKCEFFTVDEKALAAYREDPLVEAILSLRKLAKLIGTYLLPWETDHVDKDTGMIHPNFRVHGAETGRLSCNNPNVQNIPGKFREFFAAPEGQKILTLDYSQYELRVYAVRSKEKVLIDSYNKRGELMTELRGLSEEIRMKPWEATGLADQKEGPFIDWLDEQGFSEGLNEKLKELYYGLQKTDMHRVTASKVFNTPLEEITGKQRSVGKTLNFAILYGSAPAGIAEQLKLKENITVSIDEASKFVEGYHKAYPAGSKYIRDMHRSVLYPGHTLTIAGRRRRYYFMEPKGSKDWGKEKGNFEREAMNYSIQAVNADVTKRAMGNIYPLLRKQNEGARLIMQIHDELVALSPNERTDFYVRLIEQEMIKASDHDLKGVVPTEVGIKVGQTWCK